MCKKIALLCIFAFLLLLNISVKAKTLKLTTWNVEWLVSRKDTLITPIPHDVYLKKPDDFKLLGQYQSKLKADVIALQEVGSIKTLSKIFPTDQFFLFITKDSIAQHTALAVRKNIFVQIKQNNDVTALSHVYNKRPLRSGLDITVFTQNESLRILVIHLKSGCQDYPLNRPKLKKSCLFLKAQLPILQNWINNRIEEKQPFIILGDFNRIISPKSLFFNDLSKGTLFFPTAYKANPCWDGNYFIDGFVINPKAASWLQPNSLRVLRYTEQGYDEQNKLSDHCPVSIKLSIP